MLMHMPADNTVVISQQQMSLHVTIRDGQLHVQLTSTAAGLDISDGLLGHMHVAGQPIVWTKLQAGATHAQPDGSTIAELNAETDGLRYTHSIQLYPDRPFVRMWGALTNTGDDSVELTSCALAHLVVAQAPLYLFHVDQFSWPYRRDFFTPHQTQVWPGRIPVEIRMGSYPSHYDAPTSCAWLAVRPPPHDVDPTRPNSGPGFVMGIEFNGKSRIHAWAEPTQTTITSHIDALQHRLDPQSTFAVPGVFVGQYQGDWDEAGFVTQRFTEAYLSPAHPSPDYPWVQYNSWKYGQEINEQQQLQVIDQCHALGIEVFVLDLGWARCIGDWRPNPDKFPNGLAPLAARAREYGMRFGVHIAIAQCAPEAPVAHEHPEWLISTYDDYFAAGTLCFGNDPCREWIIEQVGRLIETEGIDYIIQDGEDMVKYCPHTHHTHAPGDSNYANSQLGIDVVIGTLRQRYPHVVFENCEDGGMMMTYKMAQLYHTSITVDNIATYATRQGIYGASYPFAPRYSVRYMEDTITPYTLRSSIFGGPLILMQRITDWSAAEFAVAQHAIQEYKQYRTLIRDAKIIHVLPPLSNVEYKGWGWDAIQAVSADQNQSVLMVYRAMGGTDDQVIRPRGLSATATYRCMLKDAQHYREQSGAELMDTGIALTLPEFASEIIEFVRVDTQ
jgi:alpha-galactosidase